jgi:hypothetical protein
MAAIRLKIALEEEGRRCIYVLSGNLRDSREYTSAAVSCQFREIHERKLGVLQRLCLEFSGDLRGHYVVSSLSPVSIKTFLILTWLQCLPAHPSTAAC